MPITSSCPRCASSLVRGNLDQGEGAIFSCPSCGGHWLDNLACQRLVHEDVSAAVHSLLRAKAKPPEFDGGFNAYRTAAPRGSTVDDPAPCAMCGVTMDGYVTDANALGVRVRLDICVQHGTWFDKGEAWALLQAATLSRADTHAHVKVVASPAAKAAWSAEWLAQNAMLRPPEPE